VNWVVSSVILSLFLIAWHECDYYQRVSTVSRYDTVPGKLQILLSVSHVIMLTYSIRRASQQDNRYRSRLFGVHYGPAFAGWFLTIPLCAVVGHMVDPWVRVKIVTALEASIIACGVAFANHLFVPHFLGAVLQIMGSFLAWLFCCCGLIGGKKVVDKAINGGITSSLSFASSGGLRSGGGGDADVGDALLSGWANRQGNDVYSYLYNEDEGADF